MFLWLYEEFALLTDQETPKEASYLSLIWHVNHTLGAGELLLSARLAEVSEYGNIAYSGCKEFMFVIYITAKKEG